MKTDHLKTNKQFMIGNGILAFGVILVVVIFVYMSMRLQTKNQAYHYYNEEYRITLVSGFAGGQYTIYMNDSVFFDQAVEKEPLTLSIKRFSEESSLLIVDKATEKVSVFELSEKGGFYRFEKDGEEIKQLAKEN